MSLVPEWVDLAKAFAQLGFFAVTAWLLIERFVFAKRRDAVFSAVVEIVNNNAAAFREHALATQHLSDMVQRETQAVAELRRDLQSGRRR